MPWHSPPSRREVSFLLFSLTTFILFYNLETSFTNSGEWVASQVSHKNNAGSEKDDLDALLYGNWTSIEEKVAENARVQAANREKAGDAAQALFRPQVFGSVGVNDGILHWGDDVPTTAVLKHAPGYTIMDNVFMLNGTLFIVTDDPAFPSLASIASSGEDSHAVPRPSDWRILSTAQATETLGPFGGLIHGVSWLITDALPSNYTLFALWRTYSALDTSLSPDTLTLPPPRRVIYPHVPTFMGEQPDPNGPIILRHRSPSGFHPFVAKAAFPTLGLMYKEDWADYALLHVPFVLERVVVADQGAARRARTDVPPYALPLLELGASQAWWEPIRRQVARFVGVPEEAPKNAWLARPETVVTYLSRQDGSGPRLRAEDHEALVEALQGLGNGFVVHVVSAGASWVERMAAVTQSTVVIGVYGEHMADCVYMPPSSRATVMEVFPPGVFIRDAEVSVRALGMRYYAWWEGRQHGADELPPVVLPEGDKEVPMDVGVVVQAIRRIA